jgi:hypothetical protein
MLLLYLTSHEYKDSEFCMFEGGAGWATRSIGDYIVLSLTHEEIPKFITNGKLEFCFEKDKSIPLNAGRQATGEPLLTPFADCTIPPDIILEREKKIITDYMDDDILTYWNFYVNGKLSDYLECKYPMKQKEDMLQ